MRTGGLHSVRLSATKSRMGHAEPAAGAVGIVNLVSMLGQATSHAFMSLRHVRSCPNAPPLSMLTVQAVFECWPGQPSYLVMACKIRRCSMQRCACVQVNPHVSSIVQAQAQLGHRPYHVPRQDGPGPHVACSGSLEQAAGVSAFAFQGTNAHAVLCRSAEPDSGKTSSNMPWLRRRCW